MADEVTAAAPVVESAPVVAAVEATPAPVVTETAPVAPIVEAPAVETALVVDASVEAPKPLLGSEAAEAKPADDAVTEAPKVEAAPLPVYEFKLPEGAQTDNPVFKSFQSKLGEFQNLSKAEQVAVQKFGQEMIDMHLEDVKAITENQNKSAWDWFKNRNKEWLDKSKNDPAIGGSEDNFKATTSAAAQAISLYAGTKAQQLETAKLFQETGVENHPALLRFLSNITKTAAKEGTPVSSQSAPIQKAGIAQAMYGGTNKGAE